GLTLVPGCETDGYSESIKYGVRTDPLVVASITEERYEPDRPGQLPLMSLRDLDEVHNPLYEKRDEVRGNAIKDPMTLTEQQRHESEVISEKLSGTPARPRVAGIDKATRKALKLGQEDLKYGSEQYRRHCLHCHGVSGDGRGPTARWINPHPRDYRQG